MSETTFAGLDEREANERLCAWLNERSPDTYEFRMRKGPGGDAFFDIRHTVLHNPSVSLKLFTDSHDSIHRVLDAMNDEEISHYAIELEDISGADFFHMDLYADFVPALRATPAQKATAALLALGLGKVNDEKSN